MRLFVDSLLSGGDRVPFSVAIRTPGGQVAWAQSASFPPGNGYVSPPGQPTTTFQPVLLAGTYVVDVSVGDAAVKGRTCVASVEVPWDFTLP